MFGYSNTGARRNNVDPTTTCSDKNIRMNAKRYLGRQDIISTDRTLVRRRFGSRELHFVSSHRDNGASSRSPKPAAAKGRAVPRRPNGNYVRRPRFRARGEWGLGRVSINISTDGGRGGGGRKPRRFLCPCPRG